MFTFILGVGTALLSGLAQPPRTKPQNRNARAEWAVCSGQLTIQLDFGPYHGHKSSWVHKIAHKISEWSKSHGAEVRTQLTVTLQCQFALKFNYVVRDGKFSTELGRRGLVGREASTSRSGANKSLAANLTFEHIWLPHMRFLWNLQIRSYELFEHFSWNSGEKKNNISNFRVAIYKLQKMQFILNLPYIMYALQKIVNWFF